MQRVNLGGLLAGLLLAASPSKAQQAAAPALADLILTNGVIYTMDDSRPRVQALAIAGGEVVALGTDDEIIERFRGDGTKVIDLTARTVIPGLIDAHAHVMSLGRALRTVDLVGTKSTEEIIARIRSAGAERTPGEWITGRGWDQNDWAVKEFPSHAVLDEAAPENPVYMTRIDGHAGWANRRAMELAGVNAETPDPPGGRIVRDDAGSPTGIFLDDAQALIESEIPPPDAAERAARLAAAQEQVLELGLTGVHDMGIDRATVELYRAWATEGRLLPRIVAYLDSDSLETLAWWQSEGGVGERTGRFRVRGVKLYADGALGSRGAALLAPYSDDPGNSGLLVTEPDSLAALVSWTFAQNLQPAIHAIGDRGNRIALEAIVSAIERSARSEGVAEARIEHAQVIALEDIPRFAELDVIASVQPAHATSDMYWAEDRVGPDRIEGAYAWRRLLDAGVRLACGSDFPVESVNPFEGLYAAVTRQDQEGWPAAGWRALERLSREEALACFTRWAAEAAGMEDEVGSLSVGRKADFLVLDRDVLQVPAVEIWRIRVLRTVIEGETVYEAPGRTNR